MARAYQVRRVRIPSSGREMGALLLRPAAEPDPGRRPPAILWIHGGGYVTGMAGMVYMSRALPLVRKYGAVVLAPAYRLAGESPYPAALEDCYAALRYLKEHAGALGAAENQIMVGGESAGGGLTAAVCMLARDRGEVRVAFQMPLYPMLDDRDTASSRDNHGLVWNTRLNHMGWRAYLGDLWGREDVPPYAAPARQTDWRNLPPAYTFVGKGEPFYRETLDYIGALREAGTEAAADVYDTGVHAFDMLLPFRAVSRRAAARFEERYRYAAAHYFAEQPEADGAAPTVAI